MLAPINYMLENKSPMDSFFGGMQSVQGIQQNNNTLRQQELVNEQQAAAQARKAQMEAELDQLDTTSIEAMRAFNAKYPDMAKGVQQAYDALDAKQKQNTLLNHSRIASLVKNGRPDAAIQMLEAQEEAHRNDHDEQGAQEAKSMADLIRMSPEAAQATLTWGLSIMSPKDVADNYGNLSEAYIKEDAAPVDRAATQAKTVNERVTAAGGVNKLISTAALTDDPNTFMEMIDTAYDAGLIAPEKYNSLVDSVSGDGEEAVATLRRLARGNPDIIDKLLPQATYTDLGDGVAVTEYNPQTGKFANKGTMDKGETPDSIARNETTRYGYDTQAETSRYNTDQQTIAKMHNIDLQDKQADKKLALAYAIEDNKKGVSKLENHGGKMYFVYPDGTAVEAKDIDNKPIKPTVKSDSTTRKAVAEQQSMIDSGNELLRTLRKAKVLSDQGIYFGKTAGARASLASNFKGGSDVSKRTQQYNTLITNSALQSMKSIFGGNPTEGEREILLKIQASSDYPREVRKVILDEAIAAAENRLKSNQRQIKTLQGVSGGGSAPVSTKADYGSVIEPIKKK